MIVDKGFIHLQKDLSSKNVKLYCPPFKTKEQFSKKELELLDWLFNVTINDISVIYVTAHRCAGGPKKKLDLRSGSHAINIS